MQKADPLIRTKLHPPFTRPGLVSRPRLLAQMAEGLRCPLTLITAPAGFGKTTLAAACLASCGVRGAWLSLDKGDNEIGRFLSYLTAALQGADQAIGSEASQLLRGAPQALPEAVLTILVNDLDEAKGEIALVLDDYQFISNPAVHEAITFLIEHCPKHFRLVIASRSDPPLPIARLRARGQVVELRTADMRFSEPEAAQFLNEVMDLRLDSGAVRQLEERTEGWIAGLQMAAISMRERKDVHEFIEGFSGTNRYILDYLLEEVLASQPPEIKHFLLNTSILERLTAPLCDAIIENRRVKSINEPPPSSLDSQSILEYLERTNLFLVPLDDARVWYRYHHLFADLLRSQLQKSLGAQGVAQLHLRAMAWHEQNGLILEAIHHASMASDDEMVERLIKQNYLEMMNRGEMSWVRSWTGNLSKELIYRRPWLCLYEALNRSWFGQLEEANLLLNEAENRIRAEGTTPGAQSMLGYHAYIKSRVTAMQGDTRRAIDYCLSARENVPADSLDLQIDFSITLGYEYFLYGDFINANKLLYETIQSGDIAGAINNPVAAYCLLARAQAYQGQLDEAEHLLLKASQLIHKASGQYLGAVGLVEVETAALLCERNEIEAALAHVKRGLDFLPWWGKADDTALAYTTLARIHSAQGNRADANTAIEKAVQLIRTCGVFSEARSAVETMQVKFQLAQGDWQAAARWATSFDKKAIQPDDPFQFEVEPERIARARVYLARNQVGDAIGLLSHLENTARLCGRLGRLIEIMMLKALALQRVGDITQAESALSTCLALAEPEGYLRIFLDEGMSMQILLAQWLAHHSTDPLKDYAIQLLSQFETEAHGVTAGYEKISPSDDPSARLGQALVEPLSQRELEVLHLIALGKTNQEIARQLIISPGTVKAHTASIYRKLDVANRTEAVARARQLGMLN